jgi:diaminopimelate epimerase
MQQAFHKMHGLGNDFVVLDARERLVEMTAARARALADRHRGIGCDQLILLEPADDADATMRIFNSDGGEVEACGNANRAVALLIGRPAKLVTRGGTITLTPHAGGATVDMGMPRFGWDEVPLAYAMDTAALPVGWEQLTQPAALNVGNPHVVFFVEHASTIDLERLGPLIEHDPIFPERVNVNVATVMGAARIDLRVWERGAGATLACGTGACATAVAALRRKLVSAPVTVSLPGGDLIIDWKEGSPIRMTGPATHVFSGTFDWDSFAS